MTVAVRISLKLGRLGSLIDWMYFALEAATGPAWGPPLLPRSDEGYADVAASGIYPALQSQPNVASEGSSNNTVATVGVSGLGPGPQPASGGADIVTPHRPTGLGVGGNSEPPTTTEPAITDVYRECAPAIHRMMLRLGIPERYAEDATNDVFVTALPRWNEFRGDSSRRTWLFGFALKVAANQRRKLGRAGEEKALVGDHDLETAASTSADPFEQASTRQAIDQLSSLLDTLSLEERALWLLVYYEDVSVADAAQVIGMATPKAYVLAKWVHAKLIKAWKRSNPPEAWRSR